MKKKTSTIELNSFYMPKILNKLGYKISGLTKSGIMFMADSTAKGINFATPKEANKYLSKLVAKFKEIGYRVINSNYSFSGEHSSVTLENEKYRISFNGVKDDSTYNFGGKIILLANDRVTTKLLAKKLTKTLLSARIKKRLNRV